MAEGTECKVMTRQELEPAPTQRANEIKCNFHGQARA